MAESSILDPPSSDPFDLPRFPDADFPSDLPLSTDPMVDLDFDFDFDFDIDELLNMDGLDPDPPSMAAPLSSESGVSSSSLVSDDLNLPSPDSGNSATVSPGGACGGGGGEVKLDERDERNGLGLKRKKESDDGDGSFGTNPSKSRWPLPSGEANSLCVMNFENKEEEKRKARLIRNRESAQLSRQRKKHHVEELEEKVRLMSSVISELNGKLSCIMAENAGLRHQLAAAGDNGRGGGYPPPAVYPPPPMMAPMHYPWMPFSGYGMRLPRSQVSLVPIPKLKAQQPAPSANVKKSKGKRAKSKAKKVASVSLLGLLFLIMVIGVFVPGLNVKYGINRELVSHGNSGQSTGKVLMVSGNFERLDRTKEADIYSGKVDSQKGSLDQNSGKRFERELEGLEMTQKERDPQHLPCSDEYLVPGNASELLFASLYVPSNDKLAKIDGNLIISSVLAGERAVTHTSSRRRDKETNLAIPGGTDLALPDSSPGRYPPTYRSSGEQQKSISSGSEMEYSDNLKPTPSDRPLQEWFREGLEGPIFSSGTCTEVFRFDASPASKSPGGIIPASAVANAAYNQSRKSGNGRNRRFLYSEPIPLAGSSHNNTEKDFVEPPGSKDLHSNKSMSPPMVVSVLVDPRDVDGDASDGMIPSKSISRIFVVVLLDSVKYVTYSCVLPLRSKAPHLVTTRGLETDVLETELSRTFI